MDLHGLAPRAWILVRSAGYVADGPCTRSGVPTAFVYTALGEFSSDGAMRRFPGTGPVSLLCFLTSGSRDQQTVPGG